MKVIFLDIDGVLNSDTDFFELRKFGHPINEIKGSKVINRGCLALLQQIIEDTDAKIVLSSTWRMHYSLEEMHEMFTARDFSLPFDVWHDITPTLSHGFSDDHTRHRGAEIRDYLDAHPEVEKFVILDDLLDPIVNIQHRYWKDGVEWDKQKPYQSFIKADLSEFSKNEPYANFVNTTFRHGMSKLEMNRAISILGKNEAAQKKEEEYMNALSMFL